MANLLIGNIVALIASILMVIGGYIKSKEKTLFVQTIQITLNTISCFVLGAISGSVVNLLSIPRNILAYKNKLTFPIKLIILLSTTTLSIYVNKNGIIGYLPIISTIIYILLMDKLKEDHFKMLIIFTLILWGIHDFMVKSYVSSIFDVISIITSFIAIYRIRKDK